MTTSPPAGRPHLAGAASAPGTLDRSLEPGQHPTHRSAITQLRDLEMALEQAGEELFAVVPFAGDDLTGAVINGYVDRTVADLRNLQSRVAQLRQVLHLAARSSADPSGQEDRR